MTGERLSDPLAVAVDAAVQALVERAHERAHYPQTHRRAVLVKLAELLQVAETVDAEELDRLLGPAVPSAADHGPSPKLAQSPGHVPAAAAAAPAWVRLMRRLVSVLRGAARLRQLLRPALPSPSRRRLRAPT